MSTGIFALVLGLVVYLFILLLPVTLLVALQVWLCRKNVRLGLILPGLSLALSLFLTISLVAFSTVITFGGGSFRVTDEHGNVIQEEIIEPAERKVEFHPRTLMVSGVVFLVSNIPTALFGGIWLHYKGRKDTYEDLKRMQIEDLE